MSEIDVLKECRVEGTTVFLPERELDRDVYLKVAKRLQLIGGKWNRKEKGFVFPSCPKELLEQVQGGEKVNLQKEYQFFATPKDLADVLVEMAEVKPSDTILEPSAGQGAIVDAIVRVLPGKQVDCYEAMDVNNTFLKKNPNVRLLGTDFFECPFKNHYTLIIANPPFAKNQDIKHILFMYECLDKGGRLIVIAGEHYTFANEKICVQFREWLKQKHAFTVAIPQETFKSSGTMVGGRIILLEK